MPSLLDFQRDAGLHQLRATHVSDARRPEFGGQASTGLDLYAARLGFLSLGNTQFKHPILEIGIDF